MKYYRKGFQSFANCCSDEQCGNEPLFELPYPFSLYFLLAFLGKEPVSSLKFEIYFPEKFGVNGIQLKV